MKLTPISRPSELYGSGFPNGSVAAPVGSIYTDQAVTAGAVRWIKTSGTGNTGWVVEYGDTGWRVISDASTNLDISAGRVLIRRVNGQITARLDEVVFTKSGHVVLPRLSTEYQPQYRQRGVSFGLLSDSPTGSINISSAGYFNVYAVTAGEAVVAEATFPAKSSWPSALVGTPL